MVYFIDLLFIVSYLYVGEWIIRVQDCKLRWFFKIRYGLNWIEFLIVLLYLYMRPIHSEVEREVSFAMMLTTKLVFDNIITKRRKYK
jgi:CDP-diglyceride synthetase